jgi:hypothetical protein
VQQVVDVGADYRKLVGCTPAPRAAPGTQRQCGAMSPSVPLGVVITSAQPIVAERELYWGTGSGRMKPGADVSPGATTSVTLAHFAYASTLAGDQAVLSFVNPCSKRPRCDAQVKVSVYSAIGMRVGSVQLKVQARSIATQSISRLVVSGVYALTVQSSLPIVTELAQYVGGPPATGVHPGFVALGMQGGTALSASGYEATTARILVRVFNPTAGRMVVRVTGLLGSAGPALTPDSTVAPNASLELALPIAAAALKGAGQSGAPQPVAVSVSCSGPCVAAAIEGVRGARVPRPANAVPEAWGAPLQ